MLLIRRMIWCPQNLWMFHGAQGLNEVATIQNRHDHISKTESIKDHLWFYNKNRWDMCRESVFLQETRKSTIFRPHPGNMPTEITSSLTRASHIAGFRCTWLFRSREWSRKRSPTYLNHLVQMWFLYSVVQYSACNSILLVLLRYSI